VSTSPAPVTTVFPCPPPGHNAHCLPRASTRSTPAQSLCAKKPPPPAPPTTFACPLRPQCPPPKSHPVTPYSPHFRAIKKGPAEAAPRFSQSYTPSCYYITPNQIPIKQTMWRGRPRPRANPKGICHPARNLSFPSAAEGPSVSQPSRTKGCPMLPRSVRKGGKRESRRERGHYPLFYLTALAIMCREFTHVTNRSLPCMTKGNALSTRASACASSRSLLGM
jgi:hypothetical protein